jgi:microcin C transport system substrate-binding protein
MHWIVVLLGFALVTSATSAVSAPNAPPVHGIAFLGLPKYPPDFRHFDYVNPNAPKGGELRETAVGSFDNLNPFNAAGRPAMAVAATFDTLLAASADEPESLYGLVAETIEVPEDRAWVIFNLRQQGRFHDNSPITADDVLFSFDAIRKAGSPFFRAYFARVNRAEKLADRKVRFVFAPGNNRELPLILGKLPILSRNYWGVHKFDQAALSAPLGSGPYRVENAVMGRTVTLARVPDYWGNDLPVNKGLYNFDWIRIDYYHDSSAALDAFRAGKTDLRIETESRKWALGYGFPAVTRGLVKLRRVPHERPAGMQGYAFNLRRPLFQDPRVRQALTYAFDFDDVNNSVFYGQYERTESYFANSDLSCQGMPSDEELTLLQPLRSSLPPDLFTLPYTLPTNTNADSAKDNLAKAAQLLNEAGWHLKQGKRISDDHPEPYSFEILSMDPAFERVTTLFAENLQRLGIRVTLKTTDPDQFDRRRRDYDFDMIIHSWPETASPGDELREYWGTATADLPDGRNVVGVKSAAIDALIDKVISAPDQPRLVTRVHALDRALLWGHYVIPYWHLSYDRIAYWDKFGMPDTVPVDGLQLNAWWSDPVRAAPTTSAKSH